MGGLLAKFDGMDERRLGLVFVIPALALMAIVAAYPVLQGVWLSLHSYNGKHPEDMSFIGLGNYVRILSSGHWWEATLTTFIFGALSVSVEFCIGMAMALVMNKGLGAMTGVVRVAVLVPWATLTIVTALAWKWIFTPNSTFSWLNWVMGLFAEESCLLCGRWGSMFAMVFADAWKTSPFIALLLLAGLQSVDTEMYEAADVDGASAWTKFFRITLPVLKPAILIALLFRTLDALRMFDLAYIMTGGANKTETVSVLAYDFLIKRLNIGVGSAMSVLVFIMVLGVAFAYMQLLGAKPEGAAPRQSRKQRKAAAAA